MRLLEENLKNVNNTNNWWNLWLFSSQNSVGTGCHSNGCFGSEVKPWTTCSVIWGHCVCIFSLPVWWCPFSWQQWASPGVMAIPITPDVTVISWSLGLLLTASSVSLLPYDTSMLVFQSHCPIYFIHALAFHSAAWDGKSLITHQKLPHHFSFLFQK